MAIVPVVPVSGVEDDLAMLRGVADLLGGDLHGGEGAGVGGAPHLHGGASAGADGEGGSRLPLAGRSRDVAATVQVSPCW